MPAEVDFLFLILNSIVTCMCAGTILYNISAKQLEKHFFYYAWSLGFLLYGTEIFARAYSFHISIQTLLMLFAFILFLMGVWSLAKGKNFLLVVILVFLLDVILIIIFLSGIIQFTTMLILSSHALFLPVTISILYHRYLFGRNVDKLALGWVLLYLSNIILWDTGWIIDCFAIFSKLILLLGIMDYEFVILVERARTAIVSTSPSPITETMKEGGLRLILPPQLSYSWSVSWMEKKIHQNLKKGADTIVFSFQDAIPNRELQRMRWMNPEKVFIFHFSTSAEKMKSESTVFPIGLTQVGATLSELIRKYSNTDNGCSIILSNLSLLINIFGALPCYIMLLNKMGALREGGVDLLAFFYPETHSDKYVVSLFENISDEVIKS